MPPVRPDVEPGALALSRCTVFVDFDGTISVEDVGTFVLDRFARGRWEAIDAAYEAAEIGSRQYVGRLWPLLAQVPTALLDAAADEVALDPGAASLFAFLRAGGAETLVVSDGLGFYVERRCLPFGVRVLTNQVRGGVPWFPHADRACPQRAVCHGCGTCKVGPVRRSRSQGRTTVVIGDGTSDRFGAAAADAVFAKGRLAEWCRRACIPARPYETLADVEASLRELAEEQAQLPRAERQ